jgi:hypothetical protein
MATQNYKTLYLPQSKEVCHHRCNGGSYYDCDINGNTVGMEGLSSKAVITHVFREITLSAS